LIVTAGSPPDQETIQSQYDRFAAELARHAVAPRH
jgi:hypothetical protein